MTRIPNFADIAFETIAPAQPAGSAEPWLTPEGIPVKPGYSEADLEGIDLARRPVWGWGPRLGPGHMDPERAADSLRRRGHPARRW